MIHRIAPGAAFLLSLSIAVAQHCGGPCEMTAVADPVSPNPRYTLSPGVGRENVSWRIDWHWTEGGYQKHSLAEAFGRPPLNGFAKRRVFVSPAGNGFLVTGNAYAAGHDRLGGAAPELFVFCDPQGNVLMEAPLLRTLSEKERRIDRCPGCTCCKDLLYVFAEDPQVSSNGCFVELQAFDTARTLTVFLPWGLVVKGRWAFEVALEKAEWAGLAPNDAERHTREIRTLLVELGADDEAAHTRAAEALVGRGFLALGAVRAAIAESKSGNFTARASAVEGRLRPLAGAAWEALAIDLGLLAGMLTFPDETVAKGVQQILDRLLPATKEMEPTARVEWIRRERANLKWNAVKGQYER